MVLDYFLPRALRHASEQNNLRPQVMVGFSLFYLCVLCPLFFFSYRQSFTQFYGLSFVIGNLGAGLGTLFYLKKSGEYRRAALFLCNWCVGISILLSLEAEAAYTPSLYWLPFLLTFMALLGGMRGSLAFGGLSLFFLMAFFLIAPRLSLPNAETWPHWNRHLIMHMILAQLAYYAVIFVFELLREADNLDLQKQKHRLLQSAKGQSTRSLNRLMEKKLLACGDLNRQTLSTLQKNPGRDSKINLKSLEILQRQLDSLCLVADQFLDESLDRVSVKDFIGFIEELLMEDPQFQSIDFQFKSSLDQGVIPLRFNELYPMVESSLEQLIKPWRNVQHLRIMIESEPVADAFHVHLNAYVPQGIGANLVEVDAESFANLKAKHLLEVNQSLICLTLIFPYRR